MQTRPKCYGTAADDRIHLCSRGAPSPTTVVDLWSSKFGGLWSLEGVLSPCLVRPGRRLPVQGLSEGSLGPGSVFGLWRVRFPPCLVRPGRRLPVQGLSEGSLGYRDRLPARRGPGTGLKLCHQGYQKSKRNLVDGIVSLHKWSEDTRTHLRKSQTLRKCLIPSK